MNAGWLRKAVGFASDLLIAVLDGLHPVLGLAARVLRYLVSGVGRILKPAPAFITGLTSPDLPQDFARDLAAGMISDAIEADSLGFAVDKAVPFNTISLQCSGCDKFTHFYAQRNGQILCSACLTKQLETEIPSQNRIFLLSNGVSDLKGNLDAASRGYHMKSSTDFAHYPEKYYAFRRRYDPNGRNHNS